MNGATVVGNEVVDKEMQHYSIHAQGVGAGEIARLGAFLRIGSERLGRPWRLATEGPADVLLLGQAETMPMDLAGEGDEPCVLRLVEPGQFHGLPGEVSLPLEFEALVEGLVQMEQRLATLPLPLPLPVKVQPAPEADAQPGPAPVPGESDGAAPNCTSVWPVLTEEELGVAAGTAPEGRRFRVSRTPTSAALCGDRRLMTLASLLLMRPLSLPELALQSGLERVDCERGLARLMSLGLLAVSDADVPEVKPPSRRRSATLTADPKNAEAGARGGRWKDLFGLRGRL